MRLPEETKCKHCYTTFIRKHYNNIYCSTKCRNKSYEEKYKLSNKLRATIRKDGRVKHRKIHLKPYEIVQFDDNFKLNIRDYEYLFLALYAISFRFNTTAWQDIRLIICQYLSDVLKNKMELPDHKVCTRCGKLQHINEYYKCKFGKYGKKAECKKCMEYKKDKSRALSGQGYVKDLLLQQFKLRREEIPNYLVADKIKILKSKRLLNKLKEAYPNERF